MQICIYIILTCLFICLPGYAFTLSITEKVAQAESQQKMVIQGKDGWLFFVPELRNLSVGQFWGEAAAKVSRANNPRCHPGLAAIIWNFTRY